MWEATKCARRLLPGQDDGDRRDYKTRIGFLDSLSANGSAAGRRRTVQPRPSKAAEEAASQQSLEIEHANTLRYQLDGEVVAHPHHPAKKLARFLGPILRALLYRGAQGKRKNRVLGLRAGTVREENNRRKSCANPPLSLTEPSESNRRLARRSCRGGHSAQ